VTRTETGDGVFIKGKFGGRVQGKAGQFLVGALADGVEGTDGVDLDSEKVDAQRLLIARREQVDNAAAYGVLARLAYRIDAQIAVPLQEGLQRLAVERAAALRGKHIAGHRRAGRHTLRDCINSG